MSEKRITFTGGGTAGHVIVNLALIPHFIEEGWQIDYIGSKNGIERELIKSIDGITYHAISTGKLRRYLSIENLKDPFRVLKGIGEAWKTLGTLRPNVVFSKGGFVSVPVVIASRLRRIPTIIHESDLSPGLANKIATPFAKRVLTTFPETVQHINKKKALHIGPIIREQLYEGDKEKGYEITALNGGKKTLLVMGGSSGSQKINDYVRRVLPKLLEKLNVIHICGKDNIDPTINEKGYVQLEYVHDELKDIFAITDYVLSRAGANAIFELLALQKPMLLIPLSLGASRGDQIENAKSFYNKGVAHILFEEYLTSETLVESIENLIEEEPKLKDNMKKHSTIASIKEIVDLIQQSATN